MEEATRCTIISLNIHLNSMMARADLTRSLTVGMKRSISGTCSFLDAKFRFMPRAVISLCSGSNLQSLYVIRVEEADSIDVHGVTEYGDLLVIVRDVLENTFYLIRLQMLYITPHRLAFWV